MVNDQDRISVLIVDDENKACANIVHLLAEYVGAGIHIAGIANNTQDAEEQIRTNPPDALFLDIEMPNENAFQFMERISPVNFEVIFVTAFDEYAIRAFKLNALDYILKPISINELRNAVEKLREKVRYKNIISQNKISYIELSEQVSSKTKQHKITLKDGNSTEVIDFKDIFFIEAHSSYSRIVFRKNLDIKEMTMSSPLSEYEELLPPEYFFRIHRSYLINCMHLKKIINENAGQVIINDQFTLPVGRRRYVQLISFLENNDHYNG